MRVPIELERLFATSWSHLCAGRLAVKETAAAPKKVAAPAVAEAAPTAPAENKVSISVVVDRSSSWLCSHLAERRGKLCSISWQH